MRSTLDRIRHAIGFELIALACIVLILSQLFGFDAHKIGALGVAFSLFATGWNFAYNLLFDKAMMKYTGQIEKQVKHRVVHALVFEISLLWFTLPVIAWWLNISLVDAFIMDIGLVVFYLFYTYGYNLAYDKIFPLPVSAASA